MPRIKTQTGTLLSEVVAYRTEINWDSLTQSGVVYFHMEKLDFLDGEFLQRNPIGIMEVSIAEIIQRFWPVPDGQGGTIDVPTLLVMGTLRTAFDVLYQERFGAQEEEVVYEPEDPQDLEPRVIEEEPPAEPGLEPELP